MQETFKDRYVSQITIVQANFIPEKFLLKGFSNKGDLKLQENLKFVKSFLDAVMFEKHWDRICVEKKKEY